MNSLRRALRCTQLCLVLVASILSSVATAQPSGTLVVANRLPGAGSVSLFDLELGVEVARLPIGPIVPHEVAVAPDGRTAVTGEYGPNGSPGRRVVVIDVVNARIDGYVDLGPDSRPHSFAFLPDGRVVATMERSDRIALIDLEARAVVRTYPTGGRDGHMVRLSPDGAFAYVTSRGAEGTLSVISLREDVPPVVIPTGDGAEGLAVSPDGTEVWVVNRDASSISIVNTATREVSATIAAPPRAGRAEISAGGRVVVPNTLGTSEDAAPLTVYDLGSRRVVSGQPLTTEGQTGAISLHVVAEFAFTVDRARRTIELFDLTDLSRAAVIAMDHTDPDGIAYSQQRVAVMSSN
jgi:YVTN family beta-propeller protein